MTGGKVFSLRRFSTTRETSSDSIFLSPLEPFSFLEPREPTFFLLYERKFFFWGGGIAAKDACSSPARERPHERESVFALNN